MITFRQIEAFRAIMITGTETHAAGVLSVSQPAVSRLIMDMEKQVGFSLFRRHNRQLLPTDEAVSLFEVAERVFVGVNEINETAEAIKSFRQGQLKLITVPGLASNVMSKLIAHFHARYPKIAISLEVQLYQRAQEWIVSRQCELGLVATRTKMPALVSRELIAMNAVCALPKSHRLASKARIEAADLEGESFISYDASNVERIGLDQLFDDASVSRLCVIEARTMEAILSLVSEGVGVSVVGPIINSDVYPKNVVFKPFHPKISRRLVLIHSASHPLSRNAIRFMDTADDYLKAHAAQRTRKSP